MIRRSFAAGVLMVAWASLQTAIAADTPSSRGRYIAVAADCGSCHTAPGGKPFAGGYPLKSPLGIIYGPNITPDVETGIGGWSRADFDKALRRGIAKDGSRLYPAMPYENYTQMTAADMDDLWAYIRTLAPVKNVPPKNTLPFPFNVRSGVAVWQGIYFRPGAFLPETDKSGPWNRGAYLVRVMGHCNQCHTPRNDAEALEARHALAGGEIEGWYAPDISDDAHSRIRQWTVRQLAGYLKTGATPTNGTAVGPMREAIHDSLSQLTDGDRRAMAVYLKDQPSAAAVTASKVKWPTERIAGGRLLYEDHCASCHGADGLGRPGSIPALANDGAVTAAEPYNVVMAILEGFAPQGSWGAMASFASLTDEQIADLTNYVRTAWGNSAAPNATPWGVSSWRRGAAPANDEHEQLLCPSLATDVLEPALREGPVALKRAAVDRGALAKLIGDYRGARPRASSAELVEALSTAYCRAVAPDRLSQSRMSAQLADFAQRVATALASHNPAG